MAILKQCAVCKRVGGYAREADDKVCARCLLKKAFKKEEEKKEIK